MSATESPQFHANPVELNSFIINTCAMSVSVEY
jgi:hypothetical protein